MTTFGFSAYLKLICSTPKAQNAIIRERIFPKSTSYDFHRSLRLLAKRFCVGKEEIGLLLAEADKIYKLAERKSAKEGILSLEKWIEKNKPDLVQMEAIQISGFSTNFSVSYLPDFAMKSDKGITAVHLWNTKRPLLDRRFVVGALSLVSSAFAEDKGTFLNAAVLSLRDNAFYSSSEASLGTMKLGVSMISTIDAIFQEIKGGDKQKQPAIPPYAPPPV